MSTSPKGIDKNLRHKITLEKGRTISSEKKENKNLAYLLNIKSKDKKRCNTSKEENFIDLKPYEKKNNIHKISNLIHYYVTPNITKKQKKKYNIGKWSIREDKLLKEWVEKNGPKHWEQCGKFIQGRNGKQCREHWWNCLNPELIKGIWSSEDDLIIMHFYEKCKGSWKKMCQFFNSGRTENAIKNRFYSELRKIASKGLTPKEKKVCPKIKLDKLKGFLNEAIILTKKRFLEENPMTEEELNDFIKKKELILKNEEKEEELKMKEIIDKKEGIILGKKRELDDTVDTNKSQVNNSYKKKESNFFQKILSINNNLETTAENFINLDLDNNYAITNHLNVDDKEKLVENENKNNKKETNFIPVAGPEYELGNNNFIDLDCLSYPLYESSEKNEFINSFLKDNFMIDDNI